MTSPAQAEFGSLTPEGAYTPPHPQVPGLNEVPAGLKMDREFILRHQVVERYLAGKLPLKGSYDFERFCRENPGLLEELHFADRIQAGLRLLDASGQPLPWEEKPRRFWEKLPFVAGVSGLAVVLAIIAAVLGGKLADRSHALAAISERAVAQPIDPATSTRSVVVIPSRRAPSLRSALTVGGGAAQMADLKFDLSWSRFSDFHVTIDRIDQGRVAVIGHALRDSNGQVRIAFNTTALGPGRYQFAFEGVDRRGDLYPQAWVTIEVAPHSPG